jgi:hypothetical protein
MRAIFPCFLSYRGNYIMSSIFKSPFARLLKQQKFVVSKGEREIKYAVNVLALHDKQTLV